MKNLIIAALAGSLVAGAALSPALAQTPAPAPTAASAIPAAAPGKMDVNKTLISDIIKNEKAKAALEKVLPEIAQYYDAIGGMTLADVAPISQGALDDAKLKALQEEFNKL